MATGGLRPDIAKYGYVEFKSKHLKSYNRRWLVLYAATLNTPARLVKYTNEKEFKHDPKGRHEYFFNEVVSAERISGKEHGVRVHLTTKDCKEICFTCDSDVGANDWVACIQKEVAGNRDTFEATVIHSAHANIQGKVTLHIADGNVTFEQEGVVRLRIPLTTIRKYQMDEDSVFWIETGRSSPIGEGFIHFRSDFAYCILHRLDEHARQESKRRSSTSSTPSNYEEHTRLDPRSNANYIPTLVSPTMPPSMPADRTRFPPDTRDPFRAQPQSYDRQPQEYPRVPSSQSCPRLPEVNYDKNTMWGQDRGYVYGADDRHHRQGPRSPHRVVRSNTGLVARDPLSPRRETSPRPPYMQMANTVGRPAGNAIVEGTPYTQMKNADRDSDRRDYLTPLHVRPDERYRDGNRNS